MDSTTWHTFLDANRLGDAWIPVWNFIPHEHLRKLERKHVDNIRVSSLENLSYREAHPIQVLLLGWEEKIQTVDVWVPPEGVSVVVFNGMHRVTALREWVEHNGIQETKQCSWKCTIYNAREWRFLPCFHVDRF